jgi:hypothetical protein
MDESDRERSGAPKNRGWKDFRQGLAYFALLCVVVWIVLFALYIRLPYLQSGSEIVTSAKLSYSLTHPLFDDDARIRILAFGDSKTLAALNPKVLDNQLEQDGIKAKAQSFNEGLPGEKRYVIYLERLLASGVRPTHVLVQFPPVKEDTESTWREWLRHDKMIVDTLFPFRTLPRNLALFLFSSIEHRAGVWELYRENAQEAKQVIGDRGYFFIKGQSHFPGDSLPDDYRLDTDTPTRLANRAIDTSVPAFGRLSLLSKLYGFKVVIFPPAYRTGELAPAPAREPAMASVPGFSQFIVAGEDYWLMPPRYFSDPIHTNTSGAEVYSARLAALLATLLRDDR